MLPLPLSLTVRELRSRENYAQLITFEMLTSQRNTQTPHPNSSSGAHLSVSPDVALSPPPSLVSRNRLRL